MHSFWYLPKKVLVGVFGNTGATALADS